MDWVDNFIAIGDWLDSEKIAELQEKSIDLVLDARTLFRRRGNNPFEFEPIPLAAASLGQAHLAKIILNKYKSFMNEPLERFMISVKYNGEDLFKSYNDDFI